MALQKGVGRMARGPEQTEDAEDKGWFSLLS